VPCNDGGKTEQVNPPRYIYMDEKSAPPDIPLGGDTGDIEVVDPTPLDVRQVACYVGLVICRVEVFVDEFRVLVLFCTLAGAILTGCHALEMR
jgi:hypothetical protein